ncbi:hypothetical protein CapIbe_024020 [Capra ibex]
MSTCTHVPASSRHPQTYRRSLLANPSRNASTQWFRSPYGHPACSRVNPRGGFRNPGGRKTTLPETVGGVLPWFDSLCSQRKETCLSSSIPRVASLA